MQNVFSAVKVVAAIGLVGLVVSAAGGCSSTTSSGSSQPVVQSVPTEPEPAAPVEEEAPVCEGAVLAGECGDCMKTECCDTLTACEADASCEACVTGKDVDACEKTTATNKRVKAYLVCKGGACKTPCLGAAGGACTGLLDGVVSDICKGCLEAKCCDEVSSCHAQAVCWDGCLNNFDEPTCHGSPDGHAAFHALGQCVSSSCAAECN